MDIRELEKAFRATFGQSQLQPALAALPVGAQPAGLPDEFVTAVQTLLRREQHPGRRSILENISAAWI